MKESYSEGIASHTGPESWGYSGGSRWRDVEELCALVKHLTTKKCRKKKTSLIDEAEVDIFKEAGEYAVF